VDVGCSVAGREQLCLAGRTRPPLVVVRLGIHLFPAAHPMWRTEHYVPYMFHISVPVAFLAACADMFAIPRTDDDARARILRTARLALFIATHEFVDMCIGWVEPHSVAPHHVCI
jgi:hypothetical protein